MLPFVPEKSTTSVSVMALGGFDGAAAPSVTAGETAPRPAADSTTVSPIFAGLVEVISDKFGGCAAGGPMALPPAENTPGDVYEVYTVTGFDDTLLFTTLTV